MSISSEAALSEVIRFDPGALRPPSADELVGKVTELRPWLRSMQSDAEQQQRVPQEVIEP